MERSAVNWLVDKMLDIDVEYGMNKITSGEYKGKRRDIIEQAKGVEKQQKIEFAKMHVKAALAAACEKATVDMKEDMDFYYEDYIEGVNKSSILNSYPLESIK